jgi:membrane-associated phospholipid phosphatase
MIYYMDLVGFYGPLIIGLINAFALWCRKIYLISYVLFFAVNSFINGILKNIIQQSRPSGQIYLNDHDVVPDSAPSKYGMPSGHAQSVGYSVTFLYLVVHSPAVLCASLFIGVLTVYQRFKYRRHTISQLFAGLIIGSIVGMVSYEVTRTLITQPNIKISL